MDRPTVRESVIMMQGACVMIVLSLRAELESAMP
jgi:hypothetical protein